MKNYSYFVTDLDEAFALFIYESKEETWRDMWTNKIKQGSKVQNQYTSGGRGQGGKSRHGGITNKGKQRFNEWVERVNEKRKLNNREKFENEIKESMLNIYLGKQKKEKASKQHMMKVTSKQHIFNTT